MHPNNHPPRPACVHQSTVHFKQPIPGIPHVVHGNVVPRGFVPPAFAYHHAAPAFPQPVVVVRPHAPDPRDLAYQKQQELCQKYNGHPNGGYRPH